MNIAQEFKVPYIMRLLRSREIAAVKERDKTLPYSTRTIFL